MNSVQRDRQKAELMRIHYTGCYKKHFAPKNEDNNTVLKEMTLANMDHS